MRAGIILITHICILNFLFGFKLIAQDFSNPKEYRNLILAEQVKLINENINYISSASCNFENPAKQDQQSKFIKQLEASIETIDMMPSFDGDLTLKETALQVFRAYKSIYALEYKGADSLSPQEKSFDKTASAYIQKRYLLEEAMIEAGNKFIKAQKSFNRKTGLSKEGDKDPSCIFSKVVELNRYCQDIFLMYAQVEYANSAFFQAMKKKQVKTMEENRNSLISVANEAIDRLDEKGDYNGEKDYLEKALYLTKYLKTAAENQFHQLVQLSDKKNATFEDANQFNKIVITYHKKAKTLNHELGKAGADLMQKIVSHETTQMNLALNEADPKKEEHQDKKNTHKGKASRVYTAPSADNRLTPKH